LGDFRDDIHGGEERKEREERLHAQKKIGEERNHHVFGETKVSDCADGNRTSTEHKYIRNLKTKEKKACSTDSPGGGVCITDRMRDVSKIGEKGRGLMGVHLVGPRSQLIAEVGRPLVGTERRFSTKGERTPVPKRKKKREHR